jgi:hypothetical protein
MKHIGNLIGTHWDKGKIKKKKNPPTPHPKLNRKKIKAL